MAWRSSTKRPKDGLRIVCLYADAEVRCGKFSAHRPGDDASYSDCVLWGSRHFEWSDVTLWIPEAEIVHQAKESQK